MRAMCLSVLSLYSTMWPALLSLTPEAWELRTVRICLAFSSLVSSSHHPSCLGQVGR